MFNTDFDKEYTLIEAFAELYDFKPRKRKDAQIMFEIIEPADPDLPDSRKYLRFGKHWGHFSHEWEFFEQAKNCPTLSCEERHFVSNLMTNSFAKDYMHYGAQQGNFRVHKIYDSRIDDKWHKDYI